VTPELLLIVLALLLSSMPDIPSIGEQYSNAANYARSQGVQVEGDQEAFGQRLTEVRWLCASASSWVCLATGNWPTHPRRILEGPRRGSLSKAETPSEHDAHNYGCARAGATGAAAAARREPCRVRGNQERARRRHCLRGRPRESSPLGCTPAAVARKRSIRLTECSQRTSSSHAQRRFFRKSRP